MAKTKSRSSKKTRFYSRWSRNSKLALVFVMVFAAFGGYFVFKSFAAVGDELQAKSNPVWGANMAKRFRLSPGGGWGFTMDIFGGLHPFRTYGVQPVKPTGGPYWNNFPIARDFVVTKWDPAAPQGYVMDAYGGLHPFGGAPATKGGPYWNGWDIARKVVMRSDNKGGYIMDGFGALHPFAVGANALPPAIQGPYFNNQDIARDVILTPDNTKGHILDCHGGISPFTVKGGAMPGYVNGYPYDAKRCDYVAFANVEWSKPSGYVISTNGNFAGYGTNGWPGYVDPGLGTVIDAESAVVAGNLRFWLMGANGAVRAFSAPGKPLYTDKEQAFFAEITRQQEEAARKAAEEAARRAAAAAANRSGGSSGGGAGGAAAVSVPPGTRKNICGPLKSEKDSMISVLNNYDGFFRSYKEKHPRMGAYVEIEKKRLEAWFAYGGVQNWADRNSCAIADTNQAVALLQAINKARGKIRAYSIELDSLL